MRFKFVRQYVLPAAAFFWLLVALDGILYGNEVQEYGALNIMMWFWFLSYVTIERR